MRWALLSCLVCSLLPSSARAWTDAHVRSARATVAVDRHARAHVVMDVTLRVDGGWLEGFELDGLDPDLVLDPSDPVTFARLASPDEPTSLAPAITSEAFAPRVEPHEGGRVSLVFRRRGAPRRGDYVVHVAYDTVLAGRATTATDDGVTIRWTFPAWRFGLDSVEVELSAPEGATVIAAEDEEVVAVSTSEPGLTRIALTRAHLARTREWPIDLLVPAHAVDAELSVIPEAPALRELATPATPERPWHGAIVLACCAALVALRVMREGARTKSERSVERALVPLSASWRARLVVALGIALALVERTGEVLLVAALSLAIAALAAARGRVAAQPPKLGSFRHATPSIRRAARRAALSRALGLDAWLDATTLPGLALLAIGSGAAWWLSPAESLGSLALGLALVVHAFLSGARASRPEPALVTLDRLVRFAGRVRMSADGPPVALLPVIHLGVGGQAHEARLRLATTLSSDVLRTDVVVASRSPFGVRHALLVVTRAGSEADASLSRAEGFREIARGTERVARYSPIRGAHVAEALGRLTTALAPAAGAPELRAAA